MLRKHNYPKQRKKRNTEYSKSYKLLKTVGEDRFWELSGKYGQYKLAELLSKELAQDVSPYVINFIRRKKKNERDAIQTQAAQ
jgi:hypothetical protein